MTPLRRVLADSRRIFGTPRLATELLGGALAFAMVGLVLVGWAVVW